MENDDENTPLKVNSSNELNPINNDAPPLDIEAAATESGRIPGALNVNEQECNRDSLLGCLCILTTVALIVVFIKLLVHASAIPSPDFQVKSLSFSSFKISTCEITARWNISFCIKNPRKGAKVFYDGIRVFLLYNDEFISATDMASFYQGIGQELWMNATLGLGRSPVKLNPWVARAIDADKSLRKEMTLSVVLAARVSQYPGTTQQERLWMKVFCDYVQVEFLPELTDHAGSMAAGGACTVKLETRRTN